MSVIATYALPIRLGVVPEPSSVCPGLTVPITFKFEKAGSVTVDVPVDAGPQLERNESDKSPDVAEAGH